MSSERRIDANRKNAKKSTGPKSDAGKSLVSKNALKHGLLAAETLLPWEDSAELEALREKLTSTFAPGSDIEMILVDRIISLVWRLKRAGRIETAIFAWKRYSELFNQALAEVQSLVQVRKPFDFDSILPPEEVIIDQEKYEVAKARLVDRSIEVNSELPVLGRNFVEGASALSTLHRYESGLEKSLFKTLHELQRLQASRHGIAVALPLAIDIDHANLEDASP